MPMPHRTQQQVIKRRLVGKEGSERIRELRAILGELPGYKNGPYADLRKWVENELDGDAHAEAHRPPRLDRGAARGRGADRARRAAERRQVLAPAGALGRSRSAPATTRSRRRARSRRRRRIGGVLVQLVEIPGLIEGAAEDRGGGRALLGVLRNADAILWCHACDRPVEELETIRAEVAAAGIELPARRRRDEMRRGAAAGASRAARRCPSPSSTTRASTGCVTSCGR